MSIESIVAIYGWPLTLVSAFAVAVFCFYLGRRILDAITGKKR